MNVHIATSVPRIRARRAPRVLGVLSLGPLTVVAGVVWAVLQPYRVTLLDPGEYDFWWLFVETPLLVILVGILFHFLVARPLVRDLEEEARK